MLPQTRLIDRSLGHSDLPFNPQDGVQFFSQSLPSLKTEAGADHPWAWVESPSLSDRASLHQLLREVTMTVTQTLTNLKIKNLESQIGDQTIFTLNLTTARAMNCPLAAIFTQAVLHRFNGDGLPSEQAETIELCLAEVIANAIIHGNLGLTPLWHLLPQAFDANHELRRLTLIALIHRLRHNQTQLEIIVSDAGEKFSDKFIPDLPCLDQIDQNHSPRGRGLAIIRELGVELGCILGNNSVRLSFPWKN